MLNKMKSICGLTVVAVCIGVSPGFAESDNTGWFVGGTIGVGQADFSGEDNVPVFGDNEVSGILSGPFGGYNVNQWFGIDAQFLVGSYDEADVGVLSVKPRVNFPISEGFSLFARGGLATTVFGEDDNDDELFGGIAPTIGFGARVDVVHNVKINFAVDYSAAELEYQEDSRRDGTDVDTDHVVGSVSVYYQF